MANAKGTFGISWAEIESECGDYRSGFIAVFRKYEGQPTDEKDGQNRTVKVTATSFARHMGIAEPTFRRWLQQDRRGDAPAPERRNRTAEDLRRADSKQIRSILEDLPPEQIERVQTEATRVQQDPRYRAARDEHDRKEAEKSPQQRHRERHEAERFADDVSGRVLKAMAPLAAANICEAIEEATDEYHKLIEDQALTDEIIAAVDERLVLLNREHEVARGVVSL